MKLSKCMLFVVLNIAVSFAAISNFTTTKASYLSNDMFAYNYGSTSDTVYNQIWLETSGDTVLTSADKVIYQYAMVDNDSTQSWGAGFNKMADSDTARHKFRFGPTPLNFPAARFYIRLKDANDSAYVAFTVTAITPKMTISGTVTPPSGMSAKNIWMSASPRNNGDQSYDGLTDANGDYAINIDSAGVATLDTLGVGINTDVGAFPGYRSVPPETNVSVKNGNVTGINFSFAALNSLVKGKISDKNGNGIKGMGVQLKDRNGNTLFNAVSNDSGLYAISSDSGQFQLQVYGENKPGGYMFPSDTQFLIGHNDTQIINFTVVKCDTTLYGVIRKDGALFAGKFGAIASGMATHLMGYQDITASSFTLYVAKADSYYVRLQLGEGKDTVPAGYILKSNSIGNIHPGDTAFFDFIRTASAIRGRVKDTLGGWVSGCNVQVTMQGGGNFNAITDDSGKYVCGLPQGIYTAQIDWSIIGKGYMHPNPALQQIDTLHSGDTATINFTLLPADTFITGRVTYNGGKPTLKFPVATQSVATGGETKYESFVTYDSLGYYTLRISKLKRDYYVGLAFGMSAFDTLAKGDTVEGGNFRLARAGDVVNFNIVSPPSSVRSHLRRVTSFGLDNIRMTGAGAAVTFAVPKQSQVTLRLYDMRGRLSATLANGIFGEGFHTVNIDAGRIAKAGYIIRMTWGQGQITRKVLLVR